MAKRPLPNEFADIIWREIRHADAEGNRKRILENLRYFEVTVKSAVDAELEALRQQNAELLAALKQVSRYAKIHDDACLPDYIFDNVNAAIANAEKEY